MIIDQSVVNYFRTTFVHQFTFNFPAFGKSKLTIFFVGPVGCSARRMRYISMCHTRSMNAGAAVGYLHVGGREFGGVCGKTKGDNRSEQSSRDTPERDRKL